MFRRLITECVLVSLFLLMAAYPAARAGEESASAAWKTEFEAICARTPDAMALSAEELRQLIAECDRLKPQIESLPESPRKVYGKRLEMTRNLFQFVLAEKENAPPPR